MRRRNFLSQTAKGLVGSLGLSQLAFSSRAATRTLPNFSQLSPAEESYWSLVRDQFPLTRSRIYLNNGGLGPSPYVVLDTVKRKSDELEKISEGGHSAELWQTVKKSCASIFNSKPEEIAYTRNATEGINIVCNGLPLQRGDEIITSSHEHVGNIFAWLGRQKRDGIKIKVFEPSMTSVQENLDRIEKLITPRTRVFSIMHVSTATGQIFPLEEIGKLAEKHKIWFFVDGAQAAGTVPIDVEKIGCHAYATSGHKWLLGTKGTGLLYVKEDMLDTIEAKWIGAYSNHGPFDLVKGTFSLNPTAQRYEYGTLNVPTFMGLGAAVDFLLSIGMDNVWARNLMMAKKLKDGIAALDGVKDLSPSYENGHSSMITFSIPGVNKSKVQGFLAKEYKLRTRGIYEGDLNGIRVSLHVYNSPQEVDTILEGIAAARSLAG